MSSFLDSSAQVDSTAGPLGELTTAGPKLQGASSAHFLRLIEQRGTTGFWTCDLVTGQSTSSTGLLRVMGIETQQPFRVLDLINQIHPDDRPRCDDIWSLIRSGVPVNRDFKIIRADRTVRWVEFRSEVILDADQRPVRAIGVVQDVSIQHEHELALEDTIIRYRTLVSAIAAMEWRATASGEPVFSFGWTALTGQLESDVLDGRWIEAIHPDDREAMKSAWEHAVSTQSPYVANHRILQINGEYDWFHARAVPIIHKGGRSHEWLGIIMRHDELRVNQGEAGSDMQLTPMQIRAGRAMLQWTLEDLSRVSGVSISSIRRIEGESERSTRPASLLAIRQAFEKEGLVFHDGDGVSLQRHPGARP